MSVTNPNNNAYDKKLAFKNNAPFISCISKINSTLIDNAEGLDIAMPMYNLIEYSKNSSKTTGRLWNYYRDEGNKGAVGDINYSIRVSKSFDYKTSITGRLQGNKTETNVEIVVPLKHLSNFWSPVNIPLINCETDFVITGKATRDADPDADPAVPAVNNPTNVIFKIKDTKFNVPVVTL